MIDAKLLKEKHDEIVENIRRRNMKVNLEAIEKLAELRSQRIAVVDKLRARRNEIASKMKSKLDEAARKLLISEGQDVKDRIAVAEKELSEVEGEYDRTFSTIPNFADEDAPVREVGNLDDIVAKKWGTPASFGFKPRDHVEISKICDLIDFDTATNVSGLKFYYLKNEAVLLELALEQYALSICMRHGFTPFITPDVAKNEILEGIGFSPRGEESNIYALDGLDISLVGTAEITLGGYYVGKTLKKEDLPIRCAGVSHCFRREAGAAGQYSKGLYRVHQFSKVEMFVFSKPEDSREEHKRLLAIEEEIFQGLGIPYQVIDTPVWDLGAPASRKFDIEAWMPGRGDAGEYGEVTSTSNCTDYQARALKIKCKDKDGRVEFLHTLNGTAVAVSRAIVAILENYQEKDGSVRVPDALKPFMNGIERIKCRN